MANKCLQLLLSPVKQLLRGGAKDIVSAPKGRQSTVLTPEGKEGLGFSHRLQLASPSLRVSIKALH